MGPYLLPRLIAALAAASVLAGAQERDRVQDPFLSGGPLDFQQVREAIGVVYDGRLREAIRRRGVTFVATEKELRLLQRAGAAASVLEEVKIAGAPAPPPVAPPETPAVPATLQSVLLPAGPGPASDPALERQFALQLLARAAAALGGAGPFTISGRAIARNAEWPFTARVSPTGMLITAGGRTLSFSGPGCEPAGSSAAGAGMDTVFALFCRFQPAAVLMRLAASTGGLTAEGPRILSEREWVVRADGQEAALDSSLRPSSATAPGGAARYLNYIPVTTSAVYPRQISIAGPGPPALEADFLVDAAAPGHAVARQ